MKIALCSSVIPFLDGGARNIVEWLETELIKVGHAVERVYLPQIDSPDHLISQMMAYRLVNLESADRIVCFRPPSYVIPHPHKILWFIHHVRVFYDMWDSEYRVFPDDPKHRAIKAALHHFDTQAIGEAKQVFTNSQVVSDRLLHFNKIGSEVLYPPIAAPERFSCRGFNDEIVYVSRVEHHKRQHLLVEALRYTTSPVRVRLCGKSFNESYATELRQAIKTHGLENRVSFDDAWISESDKIQILGDCLAAAYLPVDEDSYGYPSLEASHSGKPVVSTTDSGGVLELVIDGYNGYLAEPTPQALAEAMDKLYLDRENTRRMGLNAAARIDELNISWSHVLERLLA